MDSAQGHIKQNAATLRRVSDVLSKTEYQAPFDGVITNLPVREGETVVIGIQNSPGSTLMTIADTSMITAEVKVDESDIVNVQLGQPAEITIDAMPKQKFKGMVSRDRQQRRAALHRRFDCADDLQRQEAKDFKVVVALQDPPCEPASRLSATARITTAKRSKALAIPIQALTIRNRGDSLRKKNKKGSVQAAAPAGAAIRKKSCRASSCSGTKRTQSSCPWRPASAALPTSK